MRTPAAIDYSRLKQTQFSPERVGNLRVAVAGAGALGNEVVQLLGLIGIGEIAVMDPGNVEASNLTRSLFFREAGSIGANKAVALVRAAERLFPDTRFKAIPFEIADTGYGVLARNDVIFSCTDSSLARLETAYIARRLRIPMCDGGLGAENYNHGRVSYFPASEGACYGCKLPPGKRRELLTFWESRIHPCRDTPGSDAAYPATPIMAALIGALQVETGLRALLEGDHAAHTIELTLANPPKLDRFTTPVSSSCPFHESPFHESIPESFAELPRRDSKLADLLRGPSDSIVLDWPICVLARCMDCGEEWSPMRRLAAIRKSGVCPQCGGHGILELESIRTIERQSPWAEMNAASLGLPQDHLYSIRAGA